MNAVTQGCVCRGAGDSRAIVESIRAALNALGKLDPGERDLTIKTLVSDLRARHPESISILTLGPPTEAIRDPRT